MFKKVLVLVLISLLVFSSAACSGRNESADPSRDDKTDPVPVETTAPENLINIVDQKGVVIGAADGHGQFSAADAGIFYSVWNPRDNEHTAEAEYHFFRAEDRKDILLGTLPDQGYEVFYDRTELDGIVYTLAITGDPMDNKPDTLWLLAFDPMKETMTQYAISEHGFPYASLTAHHRKLWIMNFETDAKKEDKIYEFDPASGKHKEVLSYDDALEGQGSLRSIYADDDKLYVLRLVNPGSGNDLVLDTYDMNYQKVSERSLADFLLPAGLNVHGMTGETDVRNEFGMMVSGFAVLDGRYLFYENFALLRVVIDLETGVALFAGDDLHSMTVGGGRPALYKLIFSRDELDQSEILTLRDGTFQKLPFEAPEGPALTQSVSHSPSGNWLVELADDSKKESTARALCFFHEE